MVEDYLKFDYKMKQQKISIKYPISMIFSIVIAMMTWIIFAPGILSLDSLYMVLEASDKFAYTDEKALLLPLFLSLILKAGGTLSGLMLFQSFAGIFAVRYAVLSLSGFFQLDNRSRDLIALAIILLLASPLSLLVIYTATFWMDTWLGIFMLIATGLLIELYLRRDLTPIAFKLRVLSLVLAISLTMLVRLNAVILFPFLGLALERVLNRRSITAGYRFAFAFCPLMIFLSFIYFQNNVLKVVHSHQEHTVFALDVASVLKYDPMICEKALLSACDVLSDQYPCKFIVGMGAVDCTYDQARGLIYRPFYFLRNNTALEADFRYIVTEHTLAWLTVKALNFYDYLRPVSYRYFYQTQDTALLKQAGINPDLRFSFFRSVIYAELNWISVNPVLRWFSFVHLPWFILDLIGIVAIGIKARLSINRDKLLFLAIIFSIPASYYLSYLIALTASDFRFMYPSTLLMQVFMLTILLSEALERIINKISHARSQFPGRDY